MGWIGMAMRISDLEGMEAREAALAEAAEQHLAQLRAEENERSLANGLGQGVDLGVQAGSLPGWELGW